ncbi:MAG: hypothetical protein ACE5K2_00400 [Candidatus Zixiibacteriota bacterium]
MLHGASSPPERYEPQVYQGGILEFKEDFSEEDFFLKEGDVYFSGLPDLREVGLSDADIEVTLDLQIFSGGNVDLYFLDEDDYRRFKDSNGEDFAYHPKWSRLNCHGAHYSFPYPLTTGIHWLVIDNSNNHLRGSANLTGSVTGGIKTHS